VAAFSTCVTAAAAMGAALLTVWCVLPRSDPAQQAAVSTAGPRKTGSRPAPVAVPIDRLKVLNAGALPASAGPQASSETVPHALEDPSGEESRVVTPSAARTPGGGVSPGEPVRQSTPPATYRTVCVRLCDGGYFPISYATTRAHFTDDETVCQRSCGAPVRLYIYSNPGGIPDYMHDLDGNAYTELTTAFLFRSSYDPACTCRPQPWTVAAQHSHRKYALQAAGEADVGQEAAEVAAQISQPADGAAEATAAAGTGDGAGSAEPAPARAEAAEPRARKRGARAAPASLAAALQGRDAVPAPRRREAASRRFDGTDWRISPYQPF
jgi:hypothetical protein